VNGDFVVLTRYGPSFRPTPQSTRVSKVPAVDRPDRVANAPEPALWRHRLCGWEDLLMTNRHVAEILHRGSACAPCRFALAQLPWTSSVKKARLTRARSPFADIMIHPHWDMALLRVDGLNGHPSLVLSLVHPEDAVGREIAVVGYPAFDPRNDAAVQNQVFGGVYYIKRLQPGLIGARRSIQSFENQVSATTHDSSTLGGNSGSAVIDATTGHVIALHFAGLYLDANFGVPTSELARDGRVIDTGINFAPGARAEPGVWADAWQRADREERPLRSRTNGQRSPAASGRRHDLAHPDRDHNPRRGCRAGTCRCHQRPRCRSHREDGRAGAR
jgi:endonuclease G